MVGAKDLIVTAPGSLALGSTANNMEYVIYSIYLNASIGVENYANGNTCISECKNGKLNGHLTVYYYE